MINKKVSIICENCKTVFHPHYGRENTSRFCSNKCYLVCRWGNKSKKIVSVCKICNQQFATYKESQKYCSRKCAEVAKIGRKNPGRSNRLTKECDWCGKTFSRPTSNFHSKHFFCCHSCSAKWWAEYGLHGEKHPRWNGGQYKAYTDGWKPLRKKAIKRAKNKCQKCGATGRLEVHHKKPVNRCFDAKEANKLSNVIVVCPKCHAIEEKISKKKYPQIPLFHL